MGTASGTHCVCLAAFSRMPLTDSASLWQLQQWRFGTVPGQTMGLKVSHEWLATPDTCATFKEAPGPAGKPSLPAGVQRHHRRGAEAPSE
eukprot:6648432-Lingulodinium_polyedra.AAC.1